LAQISFPIVGRIYEDNNDDCIFEPTDLAVTLNVPTDSLFCVSGQNLTDEVPLDTCRHFSLIIETGSFSSGDLLQIITNELISRGLTYSQAFAQASVIVSSLPGILQPVLVPSFSAAVDLSYS
jgi:hypothetical protein